MPPKAISILLVEDSPTDAMLLRESLRQVSGVEFDVIHAERLGTALQKLAILAVDLVVLDLNLPDAFGLDTLRRLRAGCRPVPVLVLTGMDDEETALAALQEGAQDYLVKGRCEPDSLVRAIRYGIERKRSEELELAHQAAKEMNRAKDLFLATLSHELRTPLTPVLAAVHMLQQDASLSESAREYIDTICRNVETEARLIDDLLDVTRIVQGKVELQCQPVAMREVLARAIEVVEPDIRKRRLNLCADLEACPPCSVQADAARLGQVFWNLLKNAAKFTPEGGRITVRCAVDGQSVITEISDSGEGIAPELLPHIFKPFEQGGRDRTRMFGGLGLGLTITRGLVELHGGSIAAHSEGKGKGATFRVVLPMHSAVGIVPAPPTRPAPAVPVSAGRLLRILLVEDHADTARMMRQLLMRGGHLVERAPDVESALQLAGRKMFDLLISDLGLPDRSGVELMRELRTMGMSIPGIALSGYGQEQDVRHSCEAGFAVHLTKPISPDKLLGAIADLMACAPLSQHGDIVAHARAATVSGSAG